MTVSRRTLVFAVPLALFALLAVSFYVGLTTGSDELPSALINEPAPQFDLPPPPGAEKGFSTADLKQGKVSLVNVFASWCTPCHAEHPLLMELQRNRDIPIYGLNIKDAPEDVKRFLTQKGNPYTAVGADREGRVSIDWGVYGYPETFVVAGDGTILYRHVGQLTRQSFKEKILPIIREQRGKAQG